MSQITLHKCIYMHTSSCQIQSEHNTYTLIVPFFPLGVYIVLNRIALVPCIHITSIYWTSFIQTVIDC